MTATIASEWTKLRSLRSTWITLATALLLALGTSALTTIVIGATWDDWNAADRADFEPTTIAVAGSLFTAILFIVLSVSAITSEYSSGMIRLTLTATPRRGRVLAAKLIVVAAVTGAVGTVANVGMFLLAQGILDAKGLPSAALADRDTLRFLIASSLLGPALPALGISLAVLLRSTAGAITSALAIMFAPALFGSLLPTWVEENVLPYLPSAAGDGIAMSHLEDGDYLAPGLGLVVLAGWIVLFVGAAYALLVRRDA